MKKNVVCLMLLALSMSALAERKEVIAILNTSPSSTTGYGVPLAWKLKYQLYNDNGNPSGTRLEAFPDGVYEIYRDGVLWTTVSGTSGYTDYTANSGETHSYNVHYNGFCWENDKVATCYKSGTAKPSFEMKVLPAEAGTVQLSATASVSTYDWADTQKTHKTVTTVESSYAATSDCEWITKGDRWTWLRSGETATWNVAANETGEDRVGHILVYPDGCEARAVKVTIVQHCVSAGASGWKNLTFKDQKCSGAGPSFVHLSWDSLGISDEDEEHGITVYSPYPGPYYIYKNGSLYKTIYTQCWDDADVTVGETYHYTVIGAGRVIIDEDVQCLAQYVFEAEEPNYSILKEGGVIEVPFFAEIRRAQEANGSCMWLLGKDSSWVTFQSSTAGTGNSSMKLNIEANTAPLTRTATITIYPNGMSQTYKSSFTITQCGASVNWEVVDGVRWEYSVNDDGSACIGSKEADEYTTTATDATGNVVIPAKLGGRRVSSIGSYAFFGCKKITSITIPEGVMEIGGCAFMNCSSLKEVKIPPSLKRIGWQAFENCVRLIKVDISDIAGWCAIEFKTSDSNPLTYAHKLYLNGGAIEHLIIPAEVASISEFAFYGCSGIHTLTMHKNVKSIGEYTFRYCTGLTHVKISSCAIDAKLAFPNAYGQIESVVLCDDVTTIGRDAFNGCESLRFIVIPKSVQMVEAGGLSCMNLEHIAVYSDAITLDSVALWMCNSLTTVSIVEGDEETIKRKFKVSGSSVAPGVSTVNILGEVVLAGKGDDGQDLHVSKWWCYTNLFGIDRSEQEIEDELCMPSGKRDGAGNPMYVWHDFIAGTDPTNPNDTFKASITFDNETGKPVISWTPELSEADAAKREYKVFGKAKINDKDWTLVDGDAENFNFFKVSVGMKP